MFLDPSPYKMSSASSISNPSHLPRDSLPLSRRDSYLALFKNKVTAMVKLRQAGGVHRWTD